VKLLLDTSAYSAFKRGHEAVVDLVRRSERILLSTVVAGELIAGFRAGSRCEQNLRELRDFLDHERVTEVPVTLTTADRYGRVYATLRRKGTPLPTNDMWVAAQAMETGADLASLDGHFEHVDGVAWIDLR
jgi:tRNA(fMet)-specific endonuclease VapC